MQYSQISCWMILATNKNIQKLKLRISGIPCAYLAVCKMLPILSCGLGNLLTHMQISFFALAIEPAISSRALDPSCNCFNLKVQNHLFMEACSDISIPWSGDASWPRLRVILNACLTYLHTVQSPQSMMLGGFIALYMSVITLLHDWNRAHLEEGSGYLPCVYVVDRGALFVQLLFCWVWPAEMSCHIAGIASVNILRIGHRCSMFSAEDA